MASFTPEQMARQARGDVCMAESNSVISLSLLLRKFLCPCRAGQRGAAEAGGSPDERDHGGRRPAAAAAAPAGSCPAHQHGARACRQAPALQAGGHAAPAVGACSCVAPAPQPGGGPTAPGMGLILPASVSTLPCAIVARQSQAALHLADCKRQFVYVLSAMSMYEDCALDSTPQRCVSLSPDATRVF